MARIDEWQPLDLYMTGLALGGVGLMLLGAWLLGTLTDLDTLADLGGED